MAGIEFRELARLLSCREFAEAEGLRMRGGRGVCPFHAGAHNYNLAYKPDGHCYCYKCGRVADVVQYASAVWRCSQLDAARELNTRFNLRLEPEAVNSEELERRRRDRDLERDLHAMIQRAEAAAWARACDDERAARDAIERFTEADADTPAFDLALKRLAAAQMRCELLQAERGGGV